MLYQSGAYSQAVESYAEHYEGMKLDAHYLFEYGHSLQEEYMGFFRYLKKVAIPSVRGYRKGLPTEEYYAQKWEHDADILGNVKRWD